MRRPSLAGSWVPACSVVRARGAGLEPHRVRTAALYNPKICFGPLVPSSSPIFRARAAMVARLRTHANASEVGHVATRSQRTGRGAFAHRLGRSRSSRHSADCSAPGRGVATAAAVIGGVEQQRFATSLFVHQRNRQQAFPCRWPNRATFPSRPQRRCAPDRGRKTRGLSDRVAQARVGGRVP